MARYNWDLLKAKYITGNYENLKIFAEKEKINYSVLRQKAGKWQEEKLQCTNKKIAKIAIKTIEKIAEKEANRNAKHLMVQDLAFDAIEEYLRNKHFKKHIVKYKFYDKEGKADREELQSVELDVIDSRAFSNIISSLEKIQKGHRLAEGLDKEIELQKLAIEHKKLAILESKQGNSDDAINKNNEHIKTLAELLNYPIDDRKIEDFNDEEE